MNANGSDEHVLFDATVYGPQMPLWPTWRGNDEITFTSSAGQDLPVQPGKDPRIAFDVVLFRITPQATLEPAKTLSQGWPIEMKPSIKKADYSTAPAAQP